MKISEEFIPIIVSLYNEGNSIACIAHKISMLPADVYKVLKSNGIKMRTNAGKDPVPVDKIKKMYLSGISTCKIAEQLGYCTKTICNALARLGISRDVRVVDPTFNDEYWSQLDSYDKAYFLGFLAADGNVHSNSVSLQLSAKDKDILEVFKKYVNSNRVLKVDSRNLCRFRVRSTNWTKDLETLGIVTNKSKIKFAVLSENLQSHYMRGLLDGDGSITYKGHQIYFAGNAEMVQAFRDYLVAKLNVYPVKVIHAAENVYQVCWCSKRDIRAIGEYLYQDKHDCYLKRKYNNWLELLS